MVDYMFPAFTIDGKPVPDIRLRYRNVETALAEILGVDAEHLPAFSARLRNFRNLFMEVPKTGKGSQIDYSFEHVFSILLALELNTFGLTPLSAYGYAIMAVEQYKHVGYEFKKPTEQNPSGWERRPIEERSSLEDVYVIINHDVKGAYGERVDCRAILGTEQLAKAIDAGLVAFFTFNVSERIRNLMAAIGAKNPT
jgi:hypothetical protein